MIYFYSDVSVVVRDLAVRESECAWCGAGFEYWKELSVLRSEHVPFMLYKRAAAIRVEIRAREALAKRLDTARFAIPCPGCGLYQPEMVPLIQTSSYRFLRVLRNLVWGAGVILFAPAGAGLAAAAAVQLGQNPSDDPVWEGIVAAAVLSGVLPGWLVHRVWRVRQARYDPNWPADEADRWKLADANARLLTAAPAGDA